MSDLSQIVKAYDVRGTVPDQWDERAAEALGAAFAQLLSRPATAGTRSSSRTTCGTLAGPGRRLRRRRAGRGAVVIDIGLGSTDMLYYASGALDLPGAMFTASHNPARYNGIKMCRAGARPIGQDSGLAEIRDLAQALLDADRAAAGRRADRPRRQRRDLLADYAAHLRTLVDLSGIRPLKVVVDAGNGMGGYTVPAVLGDAALPALPLTIVPLYFELDGTFPNHEANPLDPANLVDLQAGGPRGTAPTSGWPSTATRTAASSSTSAASRSRRRRSPRWSPPASWPSTRGPRHPQPDHLERGTGDRPRARRASRCAPGSATRSSRPRWPAPTRSSAASTRRTTTSATSGSPTPACWPRCTCWPRSASRTAPLSELAAEYERYVASGEINSTVADQAGQGGRGPAGLPGRARPTSWTG